MQLSNYQLVKLLGFLMFSLNVLASACIYLIIFCFIVFAQHGPVWLDDNLKVEEFAKGLNSPTDIAFLGPDDLLVLEKDNGKVERIRGSKILPTPVLDENVGYAGEQGMLGIEVMSHRSGHPYVFLYYTETQSRDGGHILGNRLYRYTFMDDPKGGEFVNKTLLLDLPVGTDTPITRNVPGKEHNGGKLKLGPDGNLYLTIGDLRRKTQAQNFISGSNADGSGGILRVTPDGQAVQGILGSAHPLDKYFAYGIRNSYGIDFDPVTGYLWDTENGPAKHDEINLVRPGFNSGWQSIMGFSGNRTQPDFPSHELLYMVSTHLVLGARGLASDNTTLIEENLEIARQQLENYPIYMGLNDFNRRGIYSDPEFVWNTPAGPTAVRFYNSSVLGEDYFNHMFVGEFQTGRIQLLELDSNRTGLDLHDELGDLVANSPNETDTLTLGMGFDGVTDIEIGPDGYLYVVGINGTIYRIVPKSGSEIANPYDQLNSVRP